MQRMSPPATAAAAAASCHQKLLHVTASLWRVASSRYFSVAAGSSSSSSSSSSLSSEEQQQHRLRCFIEEQQRQRERNERTMEKIEVLHYGADGQPTSLYMNRRLSTPHDVAKHLSEEITRESALAVVNGSAWDMHRPLGGHCTIKFLHFRSPQSREEALGLKSCNQALWRSGSMLIGSVIETAFKDNYQVKLISFPPPFLQSGSFVYDCQVFDSSSSSQLKWTPNKAELRALSTAAERLASQDFSFEPLDITQQAAARMFQHNDVKLAAIDGILQHRQEKTVTVYRVGDFVDISSGPMIAGTGLIGRFVFAAIHHCQAKDFGQLMRVQALAIPRTFLTHFSSVQLLTSRAAKLNKSYLPTWPAAAAAAADGKSDGSPLNAKSD